MRNTLFPMLRLGFREATAYRADIVVYALGLIIPLAVEFFLWSAVYSQRTSIDGYSFNELISYLFTARAVSLLCAMRSMESSIGQDISSGKISLSLSLPMHYFNFTSFRQIGYNATLFMIIGLPIILTMQLIPGLPVFHIKSIVFFIPSILLGLLVSSLVSFLVGISAFQLRNTMGMSGIRNLFFALFSGILFPLSFLPGVLRHFSEYMPFQVMISIPINILFGRIEGIQILKVLILQSAWLTVLSVLVIVLFRGARKRTPGFGG